MHAPRRAPRRILAALAVAPLLVGACGGSGEPGAASAATTTTAAAPAVPAPVRDFTPATGAALLEPPSGTLLGANLDWEDDSLDAMAQRLGHVPAVSVQFAPLPFDDAADQYVEAWIDEVAASGGDAVLTLEPTVDLTAVDGEVIDDLVAALARWNDRGVGVHLRFAHEMNGSWYPWGQQPEAYVAAFRRLADAVHDRAPGTAMLWAPNYGSGYPYEGGDHQVLPGSPDAARLDTDGDGAVTGADDPYAPYYPGDDAVDWVGLSLYHWGHAYPWGENEVPEDGKFVAQITGTYSGFGGDETGLPDFYAEYVVAHDKPMAIVETAALHQPGAPGPTALEVKQAWWRQVFGDDVADLFPRLRMINWFEWRKAEEEIGGATIDWTATADPEVAAAFRADLPDGRLVFAPEGGG